MAIVLKKGSRINLAKEAPSLKNIRVALGWSPNNTNTGRKYDLDVTGFGLKYVNGDPKWVGKNTDPDFMVFYGNPQSIDGSIVHSGDCTDGSGSKKVEVNGQFIEIDEEIAVNLSTISAEVDEISFIVTIHEAEERGQNFGQIPKSHITLINDDTNEVLGSYQLENDFSEETAVQFGSLFKNNGTWMFKAVGQGFNLGLAAFVEGYGGVVAE